MPPRIADRRSPADPVVNVYHRCESGATGSVLGPYDALWYWWAAADPEQPGGWRLRIVGPMEFNGRVAAHAAILAALGESPADTRRRLQDADAEERF